MIQIILISSFKKQILDLFNLLQTTTSRAHRKTKYYMKNKIPKMNTSPGRSMPKLKLRYDA